MAKQTKMKATPEERELCRLFIKLRELKGDCRMTFCYDILAYLEYEAELPLCKIDALFIKAVEKELGEFNIEADIVLMALGLLDGCDYNVSLQIKGRREIFLRESTYIKKDKTPYDGATDDDKKRYIDNLRNSEDNGLLILSKFLLRNKNRINEFLNDIDGYIDDGVAVFPTPSYIKRKPLRDRKKKAVITFSRGSKRELFTTSSDIVINRDGEYEMTVDLSKAINLHKKRKISTLSTVIFVLLFTSLSMTTIFYTQKNTLDKSQEPNMENQPGDDTGRKYQAKEDIMGVLERTEQKLETRPCTLDSSLENGNTVSPF